MNFELKFSSGKGDFVLNVDAIAVLAREKIPFCYLLASESSITTTDQAAIDELTRVLQTSHVTSNNETARALLVRANDSKWLLYGRVHDGRLAIKARMIGGTILNGLQRTHLESGKSAFVVKKVKSALDEHIVKSKKRKREEEVPLPKQRPKVPQPESKTVKDKIKKMTVNILSIKGVTKTSPEFKDLYQHTTQAASFALRKVPYDAQWQQRAISVTEELVSLFT